MKFTKKALTAIVMSITMVLVLLTPAWAAGTEQDEIVAYGVFEGETYEFTSVDTAIETGKYFTNPRIYIVGEDATLSASTDIPKDMTLVVATSENYTADNENGINVNEVEPDPQGAFATLTIPLGVKLSVAGTLIVAGNQQGHRPQTGYLTGKYGAIDLEGEIDLTGTLYARGKISGGGTLTAKTGSNVYQRFQIADWRGGTVALNSYRANAFPFSLYTLGGIESKTVYENGSRLLGQAYVYASGSGHSENVTYIGTSEADNSLIYFSGTTGDITFTTKEVENEVYTTATINADVATNNLTFTIKIDFFGTTLEYPVTTAGLECPFGYHTDVVVSGTGTLDVLTKLKILPDCTLTVMTGGKVTIGTETSETEEATGGLYFYTAADYLPAFNGGNWKGTENATLVNNGTIKVNTYGVVACSNVNFPDVSGFVAEKNADDEYVTTPVIEYTSSAQTVTFYVGTPTTTAE